MMTTTATELTALLAGAPVGVVGLGLMGGSLSLDLRRQHIHVRGWVHRASTAERALARGLVDEAGTDPALLQGCGLVVLALPLDQLVSPSAELLAAIPAAAVSVDLGSVKEPVLAALGPSLPRFVPCHPMAGTALAGVEAGQPDLFKGRPWVITPGAAVDAGALATARALGTALGGELVQCDASDHDRAVALISHLPVLVAAALLQTASIAEPDSVSALAKALASSGFADTSRVGGGNPELGTLMAQYNREALMAALDTYERQLARLRGLVDQQQWPALQTQLRDCQQLRPQFL
jgi:arogenate dehydrogenase (NADP+)